MHKIITLTTDFGLQDYYVSAMKGVMLQKAPDAYFVDISHDIPPQDIMAGAWVLENAVMLFPEHTVHLVVVDPGVGTSRNPIALKIDDQYFVGPDNGIFSHLIEKRTFEAVVLDNHAYWRQAQTSNTFHGRDIFAPAAAHLSNGVDLAELGNPVEDLHTYHWAVPIADKNGIEGWIIHIDKFGNLITNISTTLIEKVIDTEQVKIYVGNTILNSIDTMFEAVAEGEPVAYIGSSGMLEVGINKGNAQQMLGIHKGARISLVLQKEESL
jgi:S-adenosylmethionine hydrolase